MTYFIQQTQIVTCSGGASTGSVNVVRNGAVFEELAFAQGITDITNIWGVRSKYCNELASHRIYAPFLCSISVFRNHNHLLVSTVNETHLFQINDQGANTTFRRVESVPYSGLVTKIPTIAFSNFYKRQDGKYVDSSLVVQVVPNGAFLLEWDATMGYYMERAAWKVENMASHNAKPLEIVAANVNGSQVALALSGGRRAVLCIQNNEIEFRELIKYVVLLISWAVFHIDPSIIGTVNSPDFLKFLPYHVYLSIPQSTLQSLSLPHIGILTSLRFFQSPKLDSSLRAKLLLCLLLFAPCYYSTLVMT